MSSVGEIAGRILELKAALTRAGLSGDIGLVMDESDTFKLKKLDNEYVHRGLTEYGPGFTLVGSRVYIKHVIESNESVAKEYRKLIKEGNKWR